MTQLFLHRFSSYYRHARASGTRPLRAAWLGLRFLSPLYAPWWRRRRHVVRQQRQTWINGENQEDDDGANMARNGAINGAREDDR